MNAFEQTTPLLSGGVPEWPKGSDCKSDGSAFGGSNPPPSTILAIADYFIRKANVWFRSGGLNFKIRGYRIMALTSAFQADDVGSIPTTRSI